MEMTIKTDEERFFGLYLKLISPILHLKNREREVLTELIKRNYRLKDTPSKDRWRSIFSYESRVDIGTTIGMSPASLGNNLTSLRRKNIIVDNKVIPRFLVHPKKGEFSLNFKFKLDGNSK
jgi:hypothetical protein